LGSYYDEVDFYSNNVVGILKSKSKPNEFIVFSCHYEHIGTLKTNPRPYFNQASDEEQASDSIFNGVNDNASGVSAVISLAKYYASINDNQISILLIAFIGEEVGLLGTKHFAKFLNPDSVIAVINFDMVGRSYNRKKKPYITGSVFSNIKQILNNSLLSYDSKKYGKDYFAEDQFQKEDLFYRSDNISFALNGIPAHIIMCSSPKINIIITLKMRQLLWIIL
jgi:Zn-dependent M28 family amino/carboxypeptidase